jgi:hypothetical protein
MKKRVVMTAKAPVYVVELPGVAVVVELFGAVIAMSSVSAFKGE